MSNWVFNDDWAVITSQGNQRVFKSKEASYYSDSMDLFYPDEANFITSAGCMMANVYDYLNMAQGTEQSIVTLPDGKYIGIYREWAAPYQFTILARNANGSAAGIGLSVNLQNPALYDFYYGGFTILKIDDVQYFAWARLYKEANGINTKGEWHRDTGQNFRNWIGDYYTTAPDYNWSSLATLAGNEGNFRLDLSTILSTAIGSGTPEATTSDASIFALKVPSNLRRLCGNLQDSVEQTVLYCGDNYATATRRTGAGIDVNIVYITFKFYFRSGILAFTAPEVVAWYEDTDIASPETYLTIMTDDAQEIAETNFITYYPNTGTYKYNLDAIQAAQQIEQLWIWLQDNGQYRPTGNPYDTGSTDNGGEPGNPRPQDPIRDTDLPTISGLNLGIVTLYHPTDAQIASISQFLWSDNVLDNFKKYFNNFADNILTLYVLPYTPASMLSKTFKVGNMESEITGVEYVSARYYDIDMGSVEVLPRWGSYLDYSPFTKAEIYLPYLGSHSLDVDELMSPAADDGTLPSGQGCKLSLKYRLDILTGVIVAKIFVNNNLRYQYEGKCGASIPLTGQTYANLVQGIVQAGAGLASTIATGGRTAPKSADAAVAGMVNASKPSIERIGNISGDASMLTSKIPYLTIASPNKSFINDQEKYTGFPSYKAGTLGSFSGYTEAIEAHVENVSCTEEERDKILTYLKAGVIL